MGGYGSSSSSSYGSSRSSSYGSSYGSSSSSRSSGSYGSGSYGSSSSSRGSGSSGSSSSSSRGSGSYGSGSYGSSSSSSSGRSSSSSSGSYGSGSYGSSSSSSSRRSSSSYGSGSYSGYSSGYSSRTSKSWGRTDSYSSRASRSTLDGYSSSLRSGGSYHRDLSYDTHVTNKTTIVINNNHYYAPTYYHNSYHGYSGWGGGFWSGYLAGSVNASMWGGYYNNWNAAALGTMWMLPPRAWQGYYLGYMSGAMLANPTYIDYDNEDNWQHPPIDPSRDPLEQLAQYGELKGPPHQSGWWIFSSTTQDSLSAEQARERLNQGQPVWVAGVQVANYQDLSKVVPEMAQGNTVQGKTMSSDAQQALQATLNNTNAPSPADANVSADDLVAQLPAFNAVYSPRALTAEDQVDGKNVNRTMDAAQAVYQRTEVRSAIAQWWKQNPTADRDALNKQINQIVTKALTDDLAANADAYAKDPTLESNPVDYLKDPSSGADAVAYNTKAIQTVVTNAHAELEKNLITKQAATEQTSDSSSPAPSTP